MRNYLTALFCLLCFASWAQVKVSLQESENLFIKNNLFLLAEQFNVEAARALVIQARLWENPYVSTELNAVNPQYGKAFDIGRNGQKVLAVQQLIYLGGKKKNEVEFAKANAEVAELAFNDLLRNLKYQLRTHFFSIYHDQITIDAIEKQLTNLDSLIQSYSFQVQKGNLPLKDLVRLQSLYMNLKNEEIQLRNSMIEEQKNFSLLIASDVFAEPAPTGSELNKYLKPLTKSITELQQLALNSRSDILLADKNIEAAQWNLKWQKSLAVPDLTVGASYDQRGGAFNNQVNLTVGLPIHIWNKNQGNIKAAYAQTRQQTLFKEWQVSQI